jgi:hypothetical protein
MDLWQPDRTRSAPLPRRSPGEGSRASPRRLRDFDAAGVGGFDRDCARLRYEVSEISWTARVGALFAIVKLTKALYYKHFADQCEYSLPRGFDRCVIGEVVARYSSDHCSDIMRR